MKRDNLTGLLDEEQIESHSSSLTNTRLHFIEMRIDILRARVRSSATDVNIIALYGELESLFSYLQSLRPPDENIVDKDKKNQQFDFLQTRIDELTKRFKELESFWNYNKFGIVDKTVKQYLDEYSTNAQAQIQYRMAVLCNLIVDKLRVAYQSLNFYFRKAKRTTARGIAGDLMRMKQQIQETKGDDVDELEADME